MRVWGHVPSSIPSTSVPVRQGICPEWPVTDWWRSISASDGGYGDGKVHTVEDAAISRHYLTTECPDFALLEEGIVRTRGSCPRLGEGADQIGPCRLVFIGGSVLVGHHSDICIPTMIWREQEIV
jgi:hypothetical protein